VKHRARKRFGQNFLHDPVIIDRIIQGIAPSNKDKLIEIGPGKGALTGPLLQACPNLQAIEIDRDLIPGLLAQFAKYPNFKIHQKDVLNFDFSTSTQRRNIRIVGNLPYNISTALIFHLLSFKDLIQDMHFMLQHEVVERMSAEPGSKRYGRLSIMVQYHCKVEYLFGVPPESFSPIPKVDSAIVRLTPHQKPPWHADDYEHLNHLVRLAFQQRRKTLSNSLKSLLLGKELANELFTDQKRRPEDLSIDEYVKLSNSITRRLNDRRD
jgi:16S rRNA (adenine1518-N6/adenine1519-N6)-dimethyltransferase